MAEQKQILESIHYKLATILKQKGKLHRKKHGHWLTLEVLNKTLVMDTWNNSIKVYDECKPSGLDIYGNVVCFFGNSYQIAIDFGGKRYDETMLKFWYAMSQQEEA